MTPEESRMLALQANLSGSIYATLPLAGVKPSDVGGYLRLATTPPLSVEAAPAKTSTQASGGKRSRPKSAFSY